MATNIPKAIMDAVNGSADAFKRSDYIQRGKKTVIFRVFSFTRNGKPTVSIPVTRYVYKERVKGKEGNKMLYVTSPLTFGQPDPLYAYLEQLRRKDEEAYNEIVGFAAPLGVIKEHVCVILPKPKSPKDRIIKLSQYAFTLAAFNDLRREMEDEDKNPFDLEDGCYIKVKAKIEEDNRGNQKVKGYEVRLVEEGPFSASPKQMAAVKALLENVDPTALVPATDLKKLKAIFKAITGQNMPKPGEEISVGEDEEEDETGEEEEVKPKKKKKAKVEEEDAEEEAEEEDEDDEEAENEDEEEGDEEEDDEDEEEEEDDDEGEDEDEDDEDDDEEDDDDEGEEEDEDEEGDDEDDEDEEAENEDEEEGDEEEDDEDEEEESPKPKGKKKGAEGKAKPKDRKKPGRMSLKRK